MLHVLVVDDSPVMRCYLSRTLQMTGMDVSIHEAGNGLEALKLAHEVRPDLIITDLNMPIMDGEELMRKVIESPDISGTPMMVLSANRSAGRHVETLRGAEITWLSKPVTPEALRQHISNLLEARV